VLVVAAPVAADTASAQDRANASRACSAVKTKLGAAVFAQTYGMNGSRSNAFGKCVSQWQKTSHTARHAAETACRAESADSAFAATHGGKTFTQFYGTGKTGQNALKKCIARKLAATLTQEQKATQNAAHQCKVERQTLGTTAFAAKYGTNANKSNAFGKCVSMRASENAQAQRTTIYRVTLSQLNSSGVTGTAKLTLKGNLLTVRIDATGLEAGKEHMQHIHGLANAQANATCPAASADTNNDGLISLVEGLPFYGGVLQSLTPFSTTPTGTLSYEATFTIDLAKFLPLENRTIVLHGKTVNGTYDASLPIACGEITK
jgi:hypothetical protein